MYRLGVHGSRIFAETIVIAVRCARSWLAGAPSLINPPPLKAQPQAPKNTTIQSPSRVRVMIDRAAIRQPARASKQQDLPANGGVGLWCDNEERLCLHLGSVGPFLVRVMSIADLLEYCKHKTKQSNMSTHSSVQASMHMPM